MKYKFILLNIVLFFAVAAFAQSVSAQIYEVNYTNSASQQIGADLVVQTLNYDPYPVNAGGWFDLWVKVQNIGQDDAPNVRFTLAPEFPFSADNSSLVTDFGIIPGTLNAYKLGYPGNANIVILKYRVKIADNAPEGESSLNLIISSNKNNLGVLTQTVGLPIIIGKTKTDFDVVMQSSSVQGVSFAISNIGQNDATAVTVSVPSLQDFVNISGPKASIIGNLAKGDFTTISFQVSPNKNLNEMKIQIAYTDVAGIRNTVDKIVPVNVNYSSLGTTKVASTSWTTRIVYIIIGIIIWIVISLIYRKLKKKK